MEKELGESIVSKNNSLNYKYLDENKNVKTVLDKKV